MADLSAFQSWVAAFADAMEEHGAELTRLDQPIGDGDHGTNMARGATAAAGLAEHEEFDAAETYLKKVGMTLVSTVGGASGPLYGTFFLRMAGPLAQVSDADAAQVGQALRAGVDGVLTRGKAQAQDKTMYDAWAPALEAYDRALDEGADLAGCLDAAAKAAADGRDATTDLVARKGRASYLGERSRGHIDPGAASTTLLLQAAARTLG